MNYLAIDYGTKNIGLAYSVNDIIFTLPQVINNRDFIPHVRKIVDTYTIDQIYVGLSEGRIASKTLVFVEELRSVLKLPVNTVEEAVSTIEAADIYQQNKSKKKNYKKHIDSVAAAVILRRVISFS